MSDWLTRLAETPTLRETTFAVAQGATTSCEDRVTLTWNDMQKVALVYDVENGAWDDRLPELMTVAC
ncbi:MAG: NEL-type E3 ubiquitin ligase domain-containing protein, partial [Serratia symbiotica]|nr:NEL-type E3 ubiquitin ligase domain-containing protein [Serratia symbiotica]